MVLDENDRVITASFPLENKNHNRIYFITEIYDYKNINEEFHCGKTIPDMILPDSSPLPAPKGEEIYY
jgi:hypothetical protein